MNIKNEDGDTIVDRIERQYLQRVAVKRFIFAETDDEWQILASIHHRLMKVFTTGLPSHRLNSDWQMTRPGPCSKNAPEYTLAVLKALTLALESRYEAVDDEILMLLVSLLPRVSTTFAPPIPGPVVYLFKHGCGDLRLSDKVIVNETRGLISAYGTTGFRTWEAALALGELLVDSTCLTDPISVEGKRVLELGAGTGFLSILTAKIGAAKVFSTDGFEDIVLQINECIAENFDDDTVLETMIYKWGLLSSEETYTFSHPVDLIIGADIVIDFCLLCVYM
ncbi:uncharacterized protein V1516DRAFT_687753 [Lipomyces oligophaga]|uniref:uncharacterized protein n=1 Tax=Lipomyces oligophaga TaxID=45792 RepID=UPI0034CDD969